MPFHGQGAAKSGAVAYDPGLARLVEVWPRLDEATRAAVLAIVEGACQTGTETE
jgi:hypothetical protein